MKCSISNHPVVWVVAACALLATLPAWADPPKIGIVDPQRLFQESPQGKGMLESLRAEFAPRAAHPAGAGSGPQGQAGRLQKNGATMTDDQRGRAEKELRDGERDFERARGEYQDDVTARRNEEMSRLQRTLVEEVRTYAKAQNFDLVLSGEAVLYADARLRHHAGGPRRAASARGARRDRQRHAAGRARQAAEPLKRAAGRAARAVAAMAVSLGELAVRFGCELRGDPQTRVERVATLANADAHALAFLANPRYRGAAGAHARRRGGARCGHSRATVRRRCWSPPTPTPPTRASPRSCTRSRRPSRGASERARGRERARRSERAASAPSRSHRRARGASVRAA